MTLFYQGCRKDSQILMSEYLPQSEIGKDLLLLLLMHRRNTKAEKEKHMQEKLKSVWLWPENKLHGGQ